LRQVGLCATHAKPTQHGPHDGGDMVHHRITAS
jgi:hypothetical protein